MLPPIIHRQRAVLTLELPLPHLLLLQPFTKVNDILRIDRSIFWQHDLAFQLAHLRNGKQTGQRVCPLQGLRFGVLVLDPG